MSPRVFCNRRSDKLFKGGTFRVLPFFAGRGIGAGHLVRRDFFKKVLFFDRQQWILDLTNHGQDKKQDP
jgi:hypothetical protein